MHAPAEIFAKCRVALWVAFLFTGCLNVLMLATPLFTLQVFERVIPTASIDTLILLVAVTVAAIAALALLEVARDRILARTGHRLDRQIATFVLDEGLRAGTPGDVLEQRAKAAMLLRNVLSGPTISALFDAPWTPVFIVVLYLLHPWLGIVTLVATGLLLLTAILQVWSSSERYRDMSGSYEESERWRTAITRDASLAISLGLAPAASERFADLNRGQMLESLAYAEVSVSIKAFAKFVRYLAQVAIFAAGAALVVGGEIGPGALIAASILMGRALAPLEQSVMSLRWVRSAWNAFMLLRQIKPDEGRTPTRGTCDEDGPHALPALQRGAIRLAGVTYYHPGARTPALRTVSLSIARGECLAIVGPNGSSKSTLLAAIAGAISPTAGQAELDGVAIREWQLGDPPARIGYLPESPSLYAGTILENIARFHDVRQITVAHAAMEAGVHELLSGLPRGYETRLDDMGRPLTPREQRAVALARALHANPEIVVLDTPEAGLDRREERRLHQLIAGLKARGATVVMATQRPELMRLCDRIAVLSAGAIERIGPCNEMLALLGGAEQAPAAVAGEARKAGTELTRPVALAATPAPGQPAAPAPQAATPVAQRQRRFGA